MKVFLSYAREQVEIAEEIHSSLLVRDFDVFFDRSKLQAGMEYDETIQTEIESCDLFVFLISPHSIEAGSYTLTELGIAKAKWQNPSGKILPVMVIPTDYSKIDAYLRAVTVLHPQGNIAAEVAIRVSALLEAKSTEAVVTLVSDQLLSARIATYPKLWQLTKLLPKWPRAEDLTYENLVDFSKSLRDWYFDDGAGMFLSEASHTSYAALQDTLAAIRAEQVSGNIAENHYKIVRELCSALRHSMAHDIGATTWYHVSKK